MERRKWWRRFGKLINLAKVIDEHEEAVEYDLQTKFDRGIDDIGENLSWYTVKSYLTHLPLSSALARELNSESATWDSTLKTNFLLADLIDVLQAIDYHLVSMSGSKAHKPKPYPRPNGKKDSGTKHYGKGAMKANELENWFKNKSKNK